MKLLLAEDDAILADALSASLRKAGFEVEVAANGAVAEYLLLRQNFDLGVLDLGLPLVDGLTVLKRVRAARPTMPMMVLTALDGLDDRVAGLNAGADDYLTKPFDFPELEARIRALLRRTRIGGGPVQQMGRLSFDRDARRAAIGSDVVELSPREWMLLDRLLAQRDKVVTKDQIAESWAVDRSESNPGSIERDGRRGIGITRVQRVLPIVQHGEAVALVEEKPGGLEVAVRPQDADDLGKVVGDLGLQQMREHRPGIDERERARFRGKRDGLAAPLRIQPWVVGIMVLETEAGRPRHQVLPAPLDHASMEVDA